MPNVLNLSGIALSKETGKWRRIAMDLSRNVLAKHAADVDREGRFPRESIDALKSSGLLGLLVPAEMGGAGSDILTATIVIEILAGACASTAMCYAMHVSTLLLMSRLASPEQVNTLLAPIARGELLGGFAMSEPGSGNRIWHMDSFAKETDNGYLLDSFKSFCTSAGEADFYLVPTRASAEVSASDLSLFYVDGKHPNIQVIGKWDGMGLRGNSSCPVHFKDIHVPRLNLIGAPSTGFSMMMAYSLPIYLCALSICYVGIAQAAMDNAVAHVRGRVHSDTGRALSTVETVQRYVGEMRPRVDCARAAVLRVAQMADNAIVLFDELAESDILDEVMRDNPDDPFFVELCGLKPMAAEMSIAVSHMAIQVCGGGAYKRGHPNERHYRDSRAGPLMGPSDDALKVIIGNQLLGTPQPWA